MRRGEDRQNRLFNKSVIVTVYLTNFESLIVYKNGRRAGYASESLTNVEPGSS